MKNSKAFILSLLVTLILLSGCAPAVTVTHAGYDKQFEVTVRANDFAIGETEELIQTWHQEARQTCNGHDYRVITRDIIDKVEPFNELVITGIVECQ